MRIAIDHLTEYTYETPARYGVQELRLTPVDTRGQKVVEWSIEAPGIEGAAEFRDCWGNRVALINQTDERSQLAIRIRGVVETHAGDGIVGTLEGEPPARIFMRESPLAMPDRALKAIASSLEGRHDDALSLYHALMGLIFERMVYDTDVTDADTTAAEALAAGRGVCQDFAHVFIAVCRVLGHPARYVTGYLAMPQTLEQAEAHHAWAEAEVPGLGWVGFDPANEICPDERYVRLACGPDASYAAPVRGIRRGSGLGQLSVSVTASVQNQSQGQTGQLQQ